MAYKNAVHINEVATLDMFKEVIWLVINSQYYSSGLEYHQVLSFSNIVCEIKAIYAVPFRIPS